MNGKTLLRLNPYSTGSWVAGFTIHILNVNQNESLNPYSTGSWVAGKFSLFIADCGMKS